jgi:hypothetical protein
MLVYVYAYDLGSAGVGIPSSPPTTILRGLTSVMLTFQ